jgi:hypothetical protein
MQSSGKPHQSRMVRSQALLLKAQARCLCIGSATASTTRSALSSSPAHSLIYVRLRASLDGLDQDEFTDDPTWRSAERNDKQFRKSVRDGT